MIFVLPCFCHCPESAMTLTHTHSVYMSICTHISTHTHTIQGSNVKFDRKNCGQERIEKRTVMVHTSWVHSMDPSKLYCLCSIQLDLETGCHCYLC